MLPHQQASDLRDASSKSDGLLATSADKRPALEMSAKDGCGQEYGLDPMNDKPVRFDCKEAESPVPQDLASEEELDESNHYDRGYHDNFEEVQNFRAGFGYDYYSSQGFASDRGLLAHDYPTMLSGIESKRHDAFLSKRPLRYSDPLDFRGIKEVKMPQYITEEDSGASGKYQQSYLQLQDEADRRIAYHPRSQELHASDFNGSPPPRAWQPSYRGVNSSSDVPRVASKPPVIKEGDWNCSSCGNVNWARRTMCNL